MSIGGSLLAGPIDVSPLAVDEMVFVTTREGELTCLDPESGEAKWTARGIKRFLSASTNRLYCATIDHRLVVIDTATGSRIASHSIDRAAVPFVNIASDRLYLASSEGVLTCLRESGRRWPIVRQSTMIPPKQESATDESGATREQGLPDSPSAGDDLAADDAGDTGDFGIDQADADPADDRRRRTRSVCRIRR